MDDGESTSSICPYHFAMFARNTYLGLAVDVSRWMTLTMDMTIAEYSYRVEKVVVRPEKQNKK